MQDPEGEPLQRMPGEYTKRGQGLATLPQFDPHAQPTPVTKHRQPLSLELPRVVAPPEGRGVETLYVLEAPHVPERIHANFDLGGDKGDRF